MKKNLMSILILALLVVNIILTSIMMFSVTSASNKTAALVNDIASVLKLEIGTAPAGEEPVEEEIPIENVQMHDIEGAMTVPLKKGADGETHYASVSVSFSMNTKDKGFKKHGETLSEKNSILKDAIFEVFGNYSIDDVDADREGVTKTIKEEILTKVQGIFDSKFIFKVAFSDIKYS